MSFNKSRDFNVHGGAYNVVYGDQINNTDTDPTLHILATKVASNAFHDSEQRFPPPSCHPDTRVQVLDTLSLWAESKSRTSSVFWVHGAAGVGKSAIAQTLAEKYADTRLAASFFFSRNDSTRDKLEPLVATIAYQICTSNILRDVVGSSILQTIRSHPRIFDLSVEKQFTKILLDCWSEVPEQHPTNLVIVDGLDECVDARSVKRLIAMIGIAVSLNTPPYIFLLFSRPEPHIQDAMAQDVVKSKVEYLEIGSSLSFSIRTDNRPLHHLCFDSSTKRTRWPQLRLTLPLSEGDRDIRTYFVREFDRIRTKHPAFRSTNVSWPSEDDIIHLVRRASGQFIFAATVIKYIDTCDDLPQDRLKNVLQIHVEDPIDSPYPDLDLLYCQILSTCRNWHKIYQILRLLVTRHEDHFQLEWESLRYSIHWRSPWIVEGILGLRQSEVAILLSRLHSVVHIPEDNSGINIRHASFAEFLLDSARSGKHHTPAMSSPEYQNLITLFLIRSLSSLTPYYPQFHISSPSILKTSKLWAQKNQKIDALTRLSISYCRSVGAPDNELLASLDKLNPYPLASVLVMRCSPGPERDNSFGLSIWSSFLSWAKSLEPKPPEQLVEKLETLLTECYLCFPPNLSRTSVIQTTFEFEKSLASVADTYPIDYDIQDTILQTLYSVPPSSWSQWRRVIPVVLIPRAGESAVFPGSWVTIHVTKANGEAFSQVCGHIKGRWMPTLQFWKDYMQKYSSFEEAIKNINTFHAMTSMTDPGSTRETVIQRQLIEGEDLAPVQSMIKYRAQLFDSFKDISEPQIYFDSNWELDIYNTPSREDCPVM